MKAMTVMKVMEGRTSEERRSAPILAAITVITSITSNSLSLFHV
jgi:hypothetical protein